MTVSRRSAALLAIGLILLVAAIVVAVATGDLTFLLVWLALALATLAAAAIDRLTGGMKGPPGPYSPL